MSHLRPPYAIALIALPVVAQMAAFLVGAPAGTGEPMPLWGVLVVLVGGLMQLFAGFVALFVPPRFDQWLDHGVRSRSSREGGIHVIALTFGVCAVAYGLLALAERIGETYFR